MIKNIIHIKNLYVALLALFFYATYLITIEYKKYILKENLIKKVNSSLKYANIFIGICQKGGLIRGILKSFSKPKITALITVYNSQQYIKVAIRSVQNQNMAEIEILIVDDYSTDKTLDIIEKLQIQDDRIRVIKNKKNRGVLYSRSIGILKAKGKFIMFLDSDDLFVNPNIFQICLKQALTNDIDIIEFSGFESDFNLFKLNNTIPKTPLYLRYKKYNETIRQPQLSQYLYRKLGNYNYKLIDGFLWGKCIKSKVIRDALKIIGPKIYKMKLNYGEDRLINFVLFKVAKSFKFIKEIGYIYNKNNNSNSITHLNLTYNNCHDELVNIFFMFNFTKNTYESELAVFEIFHRFEKRINPGMNYANLKYLKNMINQMLKSQFISNYNKVRLINLANNLTIV